MINTKKLRRSYQAACKDKTPQRFWGELREALREGHLKPTDFSIRECFEEFVEGGREIVDSWNPRHHGGEIVMEAGGAVNSAAFSTISGQFVYTAILEGFNAEEFVVSRIVQNVPTKFRGERIPGISHIGDEAQIVDEGQPFPYAGVGEDWIDTPVTIKRGLVVGLTREAVFFDRTNVLIEHANKVGESLGLNKEKRLINALVDENVTTHRYKWRGTTYASYQATSPWINIKSSNALVDWTDIDALEQIMAAIVDPWTGEPIMIPLKHLVVTRELLYTAKRIVSATEIRVTTPGFATSGNPTETHASNPVQNYQIVSSQLLAAAMATDTSWFLGDINRYMRYMENFPLTVRSSPANSEVEFTHDIVQRWRADEMGAAAVVEPRAMGKSTVA